MVCVPACSKQTDQRGLCRDPPAQREDHRTELIFEERHPIRMRGLDDERTAPLLPIWIVCGSLVGFMPPVSGTSYRSRVAHASN
jgi:hypothetical protein